MNSSRVLHAAFVLAIVGITVFALHSGQGNLPLIEKERLLMGTLIRIKAPVMPGDNAGRVVSAIDKGLDEIARVEDILSVYKPESEVSKINRLHKGESLKISDEAFNLIEKSIECSRMTGGAFDITVKPLVDLWQGAKRSGRLPTSAVVEAARARIGYQNIVLDRTARTISFTEDGMAIDLGAIGKGYASDRAIAVLKENGIANALVNPGGDIYCLGQRSPKQLWNVGIQHPRDSAKLYCELSLKDNAIDTAGDYEKYFIINGKRYSHIIDPRTGYPIGDKAVSATVVAPDATTADMLATAICILGRGGLTVARREGVDTMIIIKDGNPFSVETTEGFYKKYDVKEKAKL